MKTSLLSMLNELNVNIENSEVNNIVLIAIETDDQGLPLQSAQIVKSPAILALGIVNLLQDQLKELEGSIKSNLQDKKNLSRALAQGLDNKTLEKLNQLETRAREIIRNADGDVEKAAKELEELKSEFEEIMDASIQFGIKSDEDGDNDDKKGPDFNGFNINDFKM